MIFRILLIGFCLQSALLLSGPGLLLKPQQGILSQSGNYKSASSTEMNTQPAPLGPLGKLPPNFPQAKTPAVNASNASAASKGGSEGPQIQPRAIIEPRNLITPREPIESRP